MVLKESTSFAPALEQAIVDYPQINFGEIFRHPSPIVVGSSGNLLDFRFKTVSEIYIQGRFLDMPFWMGAELENGYLKFNFQTKWQINEKEKIRHPDMFAGKFVAVALTYFEQDGLVKGFSDVWEEGRDIYIQFQDLRRIGLSKKQAALKTLPGKIYSKLGFSVASHVNEDIPKRIEAIFKRHAASPSVVNKI